MVWNPTTYAYEYGIEKIIYDRPALTILLYPWKHSSKKVSMIFSAGVILYNFTEEGYVLDMLPRHYYEANFSSSSNFFKILNSRYIQSLSDQESSEDLKDLKHFVIDSIDGIIDIIASADPTIVEIDAIQEDNVESK